jgi:hypothetical protein
VPGRHFINRLRCHQLICDITALDGELTRLTATLAPTLLALWLRRADTAKLLGETAGL